MSQTERVFEIDRRIRETGAFTIRQIVEKFEVSERQVKRDIEYMRERMKLPIVWDPAVHVYGYERPSALLAYSSEKTLIFLSLLRSIMENRDMIPLIDDDILQYIKESLSPAYRDINERIHYFSAVSETPDYSSFSKVCEAMVHSHRVELLYTNMQQVGSRRQVEPLNLINYSGKWYVIAYDLSKGELRKFLLSRIEEITILKETIEERDLGVELEAYLTVGFGIFSGSNVRRGVFEIYPPASYSMKHQLWHKDQKIETFLDDRGRECVRLEIPITHTQELVGKLLSYGELARPVSPQDLVDEWKARIQKMIKLI
ncbi:MAG: WYL domain-containing protein [Sphaerochaetaceae bacterium]|nr:WYL domain-containing protein [Sphaerochaetaceae bacterium]